MNKDKEKFKKCHVPWLSIAPPPFPLLPFIKSQNVWDVCKIPKKAAKVVIQEVTQAAPNLYNVVDADESYRKFKLPKNVIPIHYTLCLKPNMEHLTYEGCVAIRCNMPTETSVITLHSSELLLDKIVWAEDASGMRQEAREYTYNETSDRVNLVFEPPLRAKNGVLFINFKGNINETHRHTGFYASKLTGHFTNGVTRLSPSDARSCFPCFDEPEFKATFAITFVLPKTLKVAISNMPVKVIYPHRNDKWYHVLEFEKTPRMSCYQLAFAIGDFTFIEERLSITLACRIFARHPPAPGASKFVIENIKRLITYYSGYFRIPFPMRKIDILLEKYSTVAPLESWGLIMFKEGRFLVEGSEIGSESRMNIIMTLSHVICRQWLANLVTLKWWTHFWVYEALTTLMGYSSLEILEPGQEMWMRFVLTEHLRGLELDALSNTHMIEIPVRNASNLKETFNILSHHKGVAILRMLVAYIGFEDFNRGIFAFLSRYSYSNASTNDLWKVMGQVSGKPVGIVMCTWSKQPGYPLIRVTEEKEGETRYIALYQEQFYGIPTPLARRSNNLWMIPISISVGSDPAKVIKEVVMDKRSITVKLTNVHEKDWVHLNPGVSGFYRVKYPAETVSDYLYAIRTKMLQPMDRMAYLSDAYALALAGIGSTAELLSVLEAFEEEEDFFVWSEIDTVVSQVELLLTRTDCFSRFQHFIKFIYRRIYDHLQWDPEEGETHKSVLLRELVISRMLLIGHEECSVEGVARFENLMSAAEVDAYPTEQRYTIYKAGMREADTDTLQLMIRRYRTTPSLEEKERILQSLGYSKRETVLRHVLEFAISEHVRHQDAMIVIKSVTSHPTGRAVAWVFFKEHFVKIMHHFSIGGAGSEIRALKLMTENFNTDEMHAEISEFFRDHAESGTEKTVVMSLERIHSFSIWYKREKSAIADYLSAYD